MTDPIPTGSYNWLKRYTKAGCRESLKKFLASWSGHARWADASNLMTWLNKQHDIASFLQERKYTYAL